MGKIENSKSTNLRRKAEEIMKKQSLHSDSPMSESDMQKLILELQVHQIELELQNEELVLANEAALEAIEKYTELYDFAPSGYFTLSKKGEILELNLKGANMLGKNRSSLKNSLFDFFVSDNKKSIFYQFIKDVFSSEYSMTCDLPFSADGAPIRQFQLTGIADKNKEKCLLTAIDVTDRKKTEKEIEACYIENKQITADEVNILGEIPDKTVQIIEKKKTEDELLKSEKKYRDLVNRTQEGIWLIDENNITSFANPSMAKMLGYSAQEMIGKSLFDFMDETGVKFANENLERRKAGLKEQHDFEFICKDGSRIYCNITTAPILDNKGNYQGAIAGVMDITKRKLTEFEIIKAKEKAEESEGKLKAALESMSDAIFISDCEGNFIDFNEAFATFHKFETKEECAKTLREYTVFLDVFTPDGELVPLEMWVVPRALRGEIGSNEEYTLKRIDTDETWVGSYNYSPIRNKNGGIIGSVVTARDITDKKQADALLKENEAQLKFAQQSAGAGLWDWDMKTNKINWSPELFSLFGFDTEQKNTSFETWDKCMHPDDKDSAYEKLNISIRDHIQLNNDYRVVHPNGKVIWINAIGKTTYDAKGNPIRNAGICIDITERKLAEEKILVAEEKLKNTFDLSPGIISKVNLDSGYFVEANQAVTRLLGYTVEEFTSVPFMELIHPDDQQKSTVEKDDQLKGKEVTFFENRYMCKDGSYKWMAWHGTKADENGLVTAIGSDINERKIIEQEIIETKQFYENIIEGVQDGIWVTNENDVIFYANSAMEKIAGVPREKIQGNNVLKDFHEETTGELIKYYKQAKKEKKPVWYVIKANTPAGRHSWQNGWLIPQYQDKAFAGIICTIRDVTQRKEAEGAVRKLSTAVEQSPSMIVITDTKGIMEYINPAFTELTGYSSIEAKGQKSNILKSGEQDTAFYKEMWDIIDSGNVWRGQFHNKKKNGELFWEAASISAILNEAGEVINYIKIGEDISELKQVETELVNAKEKAMENEEKYRLLHENAGLGIGYYGADARVISFNSIASRDMNGFPEDFTGKSIFNLFPKETAEMYFDRIQKAVHSNEIAVYEDCVQLPTQTKWFLSTYTKIVNSKKDILGIQIISQDITKIKQSETELKTAKEKAEESERLKSAFLANMSHEIRTPMNGILGFVNLLNEPNLSKAEISEYSAIINKSGYRLLDTINDIIDISKIESGEIVVSSTETSVNEEIDELYSFFLPEAEKKGISFFVKPHSTGKQLKVMTDSHKLHGILTNLIKNAIKFTEKGSIEFGYVLKNNLVPAKIEFFVKDTGIGIPQGRLQAIFNRFEQADIEDSMVYEGSGLGLAISKAYIEMLGGEISVTSEKDKGSTFVFTIPYIEPEKEVENLAEKISEMEKKLKRLNLLIVEDDEVSSKLLKFTLIDIFNAITIVDNGKDAIEKCRQMPELDLVLMDIKMPKMDGYMATQEIRKFNKDLFIIAQTAYALPGDNEKAIDAGCNHYVTKPINKVLLLAIIDRHFNRI